MIIKKLLAGGIYVICLSVVFLLSFGTFSAFAAVKYDIQQKAYNASGQYLPQEIVDLILLPVDFSNAAIKTAEKYNSSSSSSVNYSLNIEIVNNPVGNQQIAWEYLQNIGLGVEEFSCLVALWNAESGWRVNAYNSYSGAYGIPQALPGSKMASAGSDWQISADTQIRWGIGYISGRYGTPCNAYYHHQTLGWY